MVKKLKQHMHNKKFNIVLYCAIAIIPILLGGVIASLTKGSLPAFREFGFFQFIVSTDWDVTEGHESYGALPFIIGTVATSLIALLLCVPFALPVSLFVGEYFRDTKIANTLGGLIDLLAGIPSIVYGLWGFYILRPILMSLGISENGFGIPTASIILTIMIIPYAASLSTEFIRLVPQEMKEAAYGLGATQAEVVKHVVLPYCSSGIFSSYILALGRALGETMAVTMLIGNTNKIPQSIFDTGNSMAASIANQFGEADGLKLSSIIAIGLLLFLVTSIINYIGRLIIKRSSL